MILADTSIWVEHLRRGHLGFVAALNEGTVLAHPFVTGELACGNLRNRTEILSLLDSLPLVTVAENSEVREVLESRAISGRGLGWVDVHLLAACLLSGCDFWTLDKRLKIVAASMAVPVL